MVGRGGRAQRRKLWRFTIVAIATVTCSTALARSPALSRLEWRAARGCPDFEAAATAIEGVLGARSADAAATTVVRVSITETEAGRFAADIWIYDHTGSGERSFEGADCDQVAQAAELVVALALEGDASEAASPKERAEPTRAKPEAAGARTAFAISAWLAGDFGSLPQPDAGFALGLEAHRGRWSAGVQGSAFLPRTADVPSAPGSGGQFSLYTGALRACFDVLPGKVQAFELGPCGGGELGMTSGTGISLAGGRSQRVFWGSGLLGVSLRYLGASPLGIGLLAELGLPVHRAEWQVDDFGTLFQPALVVGRTSLGVSWRFP